MNLPSNNFQELIDLLSCPIPETIDEQKVELATLESYTLPILQLKDENRRLLVLKRNQYRHPSEKGLTDFDRRTMLEADVSDEEKAYNDYISMYDSLVSRIESLRLLLSL